MRETPSSVSRSFDGTSSMTITLTGSAPVAPIDPAEFIALMVTSVRDDLVRAVLAGPRASELCLQLNISIWGVPQGPPTSRFTGPRYSLKRIADVSRALEIYRCLDRTY